MIGSLITRVLVLIFGYVYPAYECFKTVELNKPDIDQLRFWCQYWILVAGLTVCERISDMFIGWIPMYGEAKLAFFIYLWFPKTKGTKYVYDSFFKPYVAKHETEIDRNLLELRIRAGDMIVMYWQKAATYSQTRIFDILQFIASQSTPPRPAKQGSRVQKSSSSPPSSSPASNTSPSEQQEKATEAAAAAGPSEDSKANTNAQKTTPSPSVVETRKPSISSELQVREVDSDAPPQEVNMEDYVRVTRARARKITRASTR